MSLSPHHAKRVTNFVRGILTVNLLLLPAGATDFSTVNSDKLDNFGAAIAARHRPVTVVSFGDSMADSYQSVTYHLMNRLNQRFGNAGYSLNNYRNTSLWRLENGSVNRGPDNYWFCEYFGIPPGGVLWWANDPNPTGVLCDRAGIFYVSQTNGGPFRLLLSTNGAPWATVMTLNGSNASPLGHFASIALPLNRYRLRVEGDAGTNFIIGASTVAGQTNGIHSVFMERYGIALNQVTNVPRAIRDPIFAALQPDLLIWHMKEDGSNTASNRMEECEAWWRAASPDCDIVYIGTPWVSLDTNSALTQMQNATVRNIALRHHRTYADLMQPTGSYSWLVAQSFMADETHLNSAGGLHCANIMWDDLGFFALGLDRRISLQRMGAQLQLSYMTTTNARYRLEVSTNQQTWSAVVTNPVATASFSTNFVPAAAATFYRLGLTLP